MTVDALLDVDERDAAIRARVFNEATTPVARPDATTGSTGTPAHKGDFDGGNSGRATVAAAALSEGSRESAVG
jgi:hypothetical protein